MSKCKHKKTIMATAYYVDFHPDQEPFTAGVVECAGVSNIQVSQIHIAYCPKCKVVTSAITDGECATTVCETVNRCNGHE